MATVCWVFLFCVGSNKYCICEEYPKQHSQQGCKHEQHYDGRVAASAPAASYVHEDVCSIKDLRGTVMPDNIASIQTPTLFRLAYESTPRPLPQHFKAQRVEEEEQAEERGGGM